MSALRHISDVFVAIGNCFAEVEQFVISLRRCFFARETGPRQCGASVALFVDTVCRRAGRMGSNEADLRSLVNVAIEEVVKEQHNFTAVNNELNQLALSASQLTPVPPSRGFTVGGGESTRF